MEFKNDLGKPWKFQDGDFTVIRSSVWSPPGCHPVGCGIKLYVDKDGRLDHVEGDENDPITQGRLCPRCVALKDYIYNPSRVIYPQKRAKEERGNADAWERCSWDEALDIIMDNWRRLTDEYGRETMAIFVGTGRDGMLSQDFQLSIFRTPNLAYTQSGYACYQPRMMASQMVLGALYPELDYAGGLEGGYDDPEYCVPELMILWGKMPLASNPDGFFGHAVIDLMKRGMKIVTVDPKVTWLATKSDLHLRVRPGTDAALALSMMDVIIKEDLYDHEFVDKWCYGFDELKARAAEFPPEKVAEITWVPADKIVAAARMLGKAKNSTLQWGVAVDMTREAMPAGQAILALWEITGNMERPGGMIVAPEILSVAGGWGRELLGPEQEKKRIGIQDYPLYNFGFAVSQPDETVKTIETGDPYEIHGAWLQTTNPLACMGADPQRLYKALNKLDFIVVVDLFRTPTIEALADVVLPAQTFAERNGLAFISGAQRGSTINKIVDIGETKSDMQINLELGKRWNPDGWPWDNVDEMFTDMLEPTGMTFEELQKVAPAYQPIEYYRYEKGMLRSDGQPGFNTPTGRIELWSNFYSRAGLDPLPYFEEPEPGPGSTPELMDEYPLVMTSGARFWGMFHSEHRQIERMRHYRPWPLMEIHPDTAAKYGIKDGDWVWMEGPLGRAKRKAKLTPIMDRRLVSCDHGWWFPEGDPEKFYDVFDLNINNTLPWIPGKSGFGSNYKSSICKIYKVEEGN
mgnify:CR=1 FL=1